MTAVLNTPTTTTLVQPPVAARTPTPQLNALTGARFYAGFLVLLFHTMGSFGLDHKHTAFSHIQVGQAVSMFFVLSGFILTFAHPNLKTMAEFKTFMEMRMARILPTHFACIIISLTLFCVVLKDPFYLDRLLAQVFLIHSLIPMKEYFFYLNLVSWSISTEFIFYLCFPFLLASSRRNLALPLLYAGISTAGAVALACALYNPAEGQGIWYGIIEINPFARIFEFAVGIVAGQLFMRNKGLFTSDNKFVAALYELLAVVAVYSSFVILPAVYSSITFITIPPPVLFYLHGCSGAIIFGYLMIVLSHGRSFASAFLSHPINVWLGEISFCLYMTHILLFCSFWRFGLLNLGYPRLAFYLAFVALAVAVAAAMHYFVELPCRQHTAGLLQIKKGCESLELGSTYLLS